MKILLDTCVWGGVRRELEAADYASFGWVNGKATLVIEKSYRMPILKSAF